MKKDPRKYFVALHALDSRLMQVGCEACVNSVPRETSAGRIWHATKIWWAKFTCLAAVVTFSVAALVPGRGATVLLPVDAVWNVTDLTQNQDLGLKQAPFAKGYEPYYLQYRLPVANTLWQGYPNSAEWEVTTIVTVPPGIDPFWVTYRTAMDNGYEIYINGVTDPLLHYQQEGVAFWSEPKLFPSSCRLHTGDNTITVHLHDWGDIDYFAIELAEGGPVGCTPAYVYQQPPPMTVTCLGAYVYLQVAAAGTQPLIYQWQKDGVNLTDGTQADGTQISGAKTDILTVVPSSGGAGNYRVVVANVCGQGISQNAVLELGWPGLMALWHADWDAKDWAGPHDGVRMNTATFGYGQVSGCFVLDGVSGYVKVPNGAGLTPAGSFTIEGWVYPRQDGAQTIVGKWGDSEDMQNQRSYLLRMLPGQVLDFRISDTAHQWDAVFHQFTTQPNAIAVNAWSHVAATYDHSTGTRRIYVNGAEVAERTDAPITILDAMAPLSIGARVDSSTLVQEHFNGYVDELSLHARALSALEVNALYSQGLLGYSKCPYSAGACSPWPSGVVSLWSGYHVQNDVYDGAGLNAGVANSGVSWAAGLIGQALVFDGISGAVQVHHSATLDVGSGNGFSIEAWMSPDGVAYAPIVEWLPSATCTYGVHFWLYGTGLYANVYGTENAAHIISADGFLIPHTFQHVMLTYDKPSGIGRLYINGLEATINNYLGTFTPQTTTDMYIGYRPVTTSFGPVAYKGMLDEVTLYNRALPSPEVESAYHGGRWGKCY